MSDTYYTSLTGMMAASYGLQNTSNNVTNMQSPGFKRTDVFYSSLGGGDGYDSLGSGVTVGGHTTNFRAGSYLKTENPSDLAVVGEGFFIIKLKNGELLYTRNGEFHFNQEGFLVDKHSGGLVQGFDKQGKLVAIREKGPDICIGKATSCIELHGKFIPKEVQKDPNNPSPLPNESDYEKISFTVENIYDAQGKRHKAYLEFESPKLPGTQGQKSDITTWALTKIAYDDQDIAFSPQELLFDSDNNGSPKPGNNMIKFNPTNQQPIVLKFGDYMSGESRTVKLNKSEPGSTTSIEVYKQDGYSDGKQTGFEFDDNGQISYQYSNGQSIAGIHLALANFDDTQDSLTQAHDNLFRAKSERGRHIGRANKENFGAIQSKNLESSNVDSTAEFANIVVLQRMFQACSQIMDIDKQLLEGLYKK